MPEATLGAKEGIGTSAGKCPLLVKSSASGQYIFQRRQRELVTPRILSKSVGIVQCGQHGELFEPIDH